jgi:hypothetical protein
MKSLIFVVLFAAYPDCLRRVFSPENFWNIGLLVAAVIGIVVAMKTVKTMEKQLEGSLHVDGVRVVGLQEGQQPIFFVKVVNSGVLAKEVSIAITVRFPDGITKYHNAVAMLIPAQGGREFFISSGIIPNKASLESLNAETLRVSGCIKWGKKKDKKEYCYKYNPCSFGTWPDGVPDFVPCDFNMGRDATVFARGVGAAAAIGTVSAVVENPSTKTPPTASS